MSVGFQDKSPPERPPLEHLIWRVTKDTRAAEALVRVLPARAMAAVQRAAARDQAAEEAPPEPAHIAGGLS